MLLQLEFLPSTFLVIISLQNLILTVKREEIWDDCFFGCCCKNAMSWLTLCSDFIISYSGVFGIWWKVPFPDLIPEKRSSVCTLWITSTDFYLVITFRLFIMLHRFPIESASRHKKLQEVCKFVTLFFFS